MKARTDDAGWSTGPASANDMAVDETAAEKEAAPSTSVEPSGKDQAHTSMHACMHTSALWWPAVCWWHGVNMLVNLMLPSGKVGGSSMMQLDQPAGKKRKLGVAAPTL